MKKLVILAALSLLVFGANNAHAEWLMLTESADEEMAIYADPTTARFSGNIVTVWTLLNLRSAEKTSDGKKYQSIAALEEYDCVNARSRSHAIVRYSGSMGNGKAVESANFVSAWAAIPPRTLNDTVLRVSCPNR